MLCFLFLGFYIVRLIQFLLTTSLAVNMAQSNLICICLAALGVFTFFSQEMSLLTQLSCLLLIIDGAMGAAIFVSHNQEDIYKELGVYKEFKQSKYLGLNCQGHITNLNFEYKQRV